VSSLLKLTLGLLFSNTISNYFSVDARFFKSFLPLLFRPGYLASRFIEGKRLLYLHPAQLYLFISVVFFFLFSFKISKQEKAIEIENEVKKATENISDEKVKDSIGKTMIINKYKENQEALGMDDDDLRNLDSILKEEAYKGDMNAVSFGEFETKKIDSLLKTNASDDYILKEIGLKEDSGYFERKFIEQGFKAYKDKGSIANILRSFYDTIPISLFILLPIFALIMKLLFYKRSFNKFYMELYSWMARIYTCVINLYLSMDSC